MDERECSPSRGETDQPPIPAEVRDFGGTHGSPNVSGVSCRKTWLVEIERKQFDVIVVDADSFDEALVKGQKSLYQIRTKSTITATAVEKTPKGEKPIESAYYD